MSEKILRDILMAKDGMDADNISVLVANFEKRHPTCITLISKLKEAASRFGTASAPDLQEAVAIAVEIMAA